MVVVFLKRSSPKLHCLLGADRSHKCGVWRKFTTGPFSTLHTHLSLLQNNHSLQPDPQQDIAGLHIPHCMSKVAASTPKGLPLDDTIEFIKDVIREQRLEKFYDLSQPGMDQQIEGLAKRIQLVPEKFNMSPQIAIDLVYLALYDLCILIGMIPLSCDHPFGRPN